MQFTRAERMFLKLHPDLNEKWGPRSYCILSVNSWTRPLVLRDKERIQPRAGRLDLLLQDPESKRRYEVEIQLGSTDEAHIIRTIEYWDLEKNVILNMITAPFLLRKISPADS